MNNLKLKALSGLLWSFTEQFSMQIIMFVVSVVMARMLMPEEFGLIAMPTVFIAIGIALRDSGLSSSLIRTKNPTNRDYSTVFYINIIFSVVTYAIVYFVAPYISDFYDKPILINIIRLQALTIVIGSITSIQHTRLTKAMNFKKQMNLQVLSVIVSAACGIGFAYYGYGVWSLVYMNIIQYVIAAFNYWLASSWRPEWIFDYNMAKKHLHFGYKLTLSGILNVFYENFYTILIGKFFGASHLGFYTRAKSTQELPIKNISAALNKVTYSLFSEIQDDNNKLKDVYAKIMQQLLFWILPTMLIAATVAEPLFIFVFSEKWISAVPYFQLLCFAGILAPLNMYNLNILNVKGRSDLYLIAEIINKGFIIGTSIVFIEYGIESLLYFQIIASIISFLINSFISGKVISFGPHEQLKNILPILANGLIMGAVTWSSYHLIEGIIVSDFFKVVIISMIGVSTYLLLGKVFRLEPLRELTELLTKRKALS